MGEKEEEEGVGNAISLGWQDEREKLKLQMRVIWGIRIPFLPGLTCLSLLADGEWEM